MAFAEVLDVGKTQLHLPPDRLRIIDNDRITAPCLIAENLSGDLPSHVLAANLRRVFSGIVSGNVRDDAMAAIEQKGPYEINGSPRILSLLDRLLTAFVAQGRMKLAADNYSPCYRVIS